MKFFKYLLLILLYLVAGFLFDGNHVWMILTTLGGAFILCSYFLLKVNMKSWRNEVLKILLPLFVLLFITSVNSSFYYSLKYLIFLPIIGLLSFWVVKMQRITMVMASVLVIVFATFIFSPNQMALFNQSKISGTIPYVELDLIDENGQAVSFDAKKTVVLDFWTTKCSACFKKFPAYEDVFEHYKDDVRVEVYAVNVSLKTDVFSETLERFQKLSYEFPTLFLTNSHSLKQKYNIDGYPHILINKNRQVEYSGAMGTSPFIFVNNLYSEINKTLK